MALDNEKKKREAARSSASGSSAALRNAAQMIPAAQQQNATSSTQTGKMPTVSAAKQESSGTTVSMPSVRSAASVIPTAQKAQTARQKMLYQQEEQPKWYSGETPTRSEAQAQIYRISQQDPAKGKQLFDAFQTFQADPSNPMYNPYTKATSNAVQHLSELGYDLSGGFSQDWLDQNAALKNYYRTTTGTTPLAPSSSSTPEQDAAYWYYKAQNDEATTQKAETEWQALQDEIAYWTNRTDRNYSDDEILAKIDWKNYSTLTGMDEDAAKGTPTQLTRPVGYSQDALRGVIWATRNGVTTDDGNNSVRAALGQGNKWKENSEISQKLDPASEYYSPYSVSSTVDDAAIYFGVDSFGKDWLTENRDVLSSDDKTAKTMYTKVYNAEQTTLEAESELAELNQLVDKYCDRYDDPETVLKYLANRVDEDFPTLAKLDKGIASGSLVSTTRPIAYSWGDVRRTVQQRLDEKNNATPATQTIGKALGVTADENPTFDAITSAAKHNVSEAADLIEQSGTDAEKRKVLTAGTPEFNTLVQSVSDMMAKVKAKADKVYAEQQKALYNTSSNAQAMNDAAAVGGVLAQQNLPSSPVNFGEIVAQSILEKGKQQEYTSAANSAFASVANRSDLTAAQRQKLNGIIQSMSQSTAETAETAETPAQTVSPSPYQESNLPDANKETIGKERNKLTATAEEATATDETAQVQDAEKNSRDSLPETTREKRSAKEFQKPEAESPELATARQEVLNALLDAQTAQNAQEYENTVRGALEDAIGIKSRENMTLGEYASQPLQGVTAARNARNTELLNVMNRQDEMYVADAYLWALEWIAPYQQADKERAELQAELDAMIESDPWITSSLNIRAYYNENKYDPSSQSYTYEKTLREAQTLQKRILNVEEKMSGLEENYHKGESILDNIGRKYQRSMLLSNVPGGKPMDTTMVDVLTYVYNYGTNYQPTTWSAYSNMESALTSGENAETVAKYADDVETAAKQGIESIDAIIEYLDEKDVVLPNGETTYINNLRRQQKLFRQELDGVEYWRLQQNADFKEKAEEAKRDIQENASSYINPSVGDVFKAIGESTGWFGDYSVEDVQIANFDEIRKAYDPNNLAAHGYDGNYNYMTENERNTYLYLRETEGKEAATAYYKYLQDNVLSVRAYESATEFTKEKTHDDHIGMTIASVLMSPSQVMGTLYSIGQVIKGEEINPYNVAFAGSSFVNTVRNTTKEDMSVAVDDWMGDNPAKGFVKWLSTAAYDAATSAGDSALNSVLFGNALSGIATNALAREGMSKGAQFAVRALAGFAGASPMGLQAAGAAMQDVKFRGGSDEQALMIGLINFGAETITEAITLDNIQETFHAASAGEAKGFLKTILHSALEEAPGEAINELVEGLGDDWIMGSLSNHNLEIAEYERQGMTHEQAVRKAGFNFFLDCLNAGIVGGLSGSMSSSVSYGAGKAKNKYNQHKANKALESVVHEAIEANEQQNGEQTTEQTTPTETQEAPATEQDTTEQQEEPTEQAEAPAETVQIDEQDNEEKLTRIAALGNVDLIQDTSMQTAIIANSLLNAEGTNLDVASATAETLAFATSPQEAANTVSDLLTVASTENVRMNDVQEALANAVLGNGQAAQALDAIKRDGVSKETMHALLEASAQDRVNQQVQDEVAGMVRENAIASEVVRMIGDGALNGLRTYEASVSKAQTALTNAQEAVQQFAERAKAAGENLQKVNEQFIADAANAALAGMVEQATKEVQSVAVQRQQAETTLRTRQEELRAARETLKVAQEEALSRVRQEATQMVAEAAEAAQQEEVARQQATAQEAAQKAIQGLSGTLYTTDNTPINFHYALVDPSALIVSNDAQNGAVNPAYPAELQPRDRTRAESVQTTQDRARNLNPERLGESISAQEGAPVIGADGVVESGNGRVMAIQQAMQNNPERAKAYTDFLRKNAAKYGIDPSAITDKSILVRVRDTDVDRVAFTRQANESQTSTFSDTETARQDAEKLTGEILATYNANSENINSRTNGEFVTRFLDKVIPASEKGKYMQSNGTVSQQFVTRMRNALFELAYKSSQLTTALAESTDENVKNILNALTAVAPLVATTTQQIAEGKLNALDPAQAIAQAAEAYRRVKASGQSVAEYTNQLTIPGFETESDGAKALMQYFEENGRSVKKLKEGIKGIYDLLRSYGNPNQQSFLEGGNVPANVDTLIQQGLKESQRDLLSGISFAMAREQNGEGETASITPEEVTRRMQDNREMLSGEQILKNLEQLTGIPIDNRRKKFLREYRKKAFGYAYQDYGTTHIQDASDVESAMHEYGHVFDKQLDLTGKLSKSEIDQMVTNLKINPEILNVSAYTEAQLRQEAIAELMRRWFVDREAGIRFGGAHAVDTLETELSKKKFLKGIQEAAADYRLAQTQTAFERAQGYVQLEPPKKVKQMYATGLDGLITKISDKTQPLLDITIAGKEKAKKEGRAFNFSNDPRTVELARNNAVKTYFERCVEGKGNGGMVTSDGRPVLDKNGNQFRSLRAIIDDGGIQQKDERAFNGMWLAIHALYRQNKEHQGKIGVKNIFGRDVKVDAAVEQAIAEHPDWLKTIVEIEDWYTAFVQAWIIDTHATAMTQEQFDFLREQYPFYIPTYRVGRDARTGSGTMNDPNADPGSTVFRRAKGSMEMVYNPVMGLVENVQNMISVVKHLETYRAYNSAFKNGVTQQGTVEPAQADMRMVDNRAANARAQEQLQKAIDSLRGSFILEDATADILEHALDSLPEKSFYYEETASGDDVLNFRDKNGEMVRLTVYNKPIFEAMQDVDRVKQIGVFRLIRNFMGFFSQNVTARNLGFTGQNWFSDTETAINTGEIAFRWRNYPAFMAQQLYSLTNILYNEVKVKMGETASQEYLDFNLHGRIDSRYALRDTKTQQEIRKTLYAENKGIDAAKVAEKTKAILRSPITTVEALSDLLESSTRYTSFRLSKTKAEKARGSSTYSELLRRGQIAREATTDFSKVGTSKAMQYAKMYIPFVGATTQGITKTVQMWTRANKGQRAKMAATMAVNAILPNLIMAAIRNILWDDDEKEAWENMSFYEKNKYWHFKLGDNWFVRIKRSQDGFIQAADALGTFLGDVLTGYEGDAWGNLMATAQEIVSNMMIDYNPVWSAFTDASNNLTWYGGQIDNYYDLQLPATQRYDDDTTALAKGASVLLSAAGIDWSPKRLDYVAQQYFGSMGLIGSDLLRATFDGKLDAETVGEILQTRVGKSYVVNPILTNNLSSTFYSSADAISQVTSEASQRGTASLIRTDLTETEMQDAVDEATAMTKKGGIIYETKAELKTLYEQKEDVLNRTDLTKEARTKAAIEIQKQINTLCLNTNRQIGDFWNKYGYSNNVERAFNLIGNTFGWSQGTEYVPRTDYDRLPDVFKEDADANYMKCAQSTWEASAEDPSARKSTLLPHPLTTITINKQKVDLTEEEQQVYNEAYRDEYERYVENNWEDAETQQEQEEVLENAHRKAHEKGKNAWKTGFPKRVPEKQ